MTRRTWCDVAFVMPWRTHGAAGHARVDIQTGSSRLCFPQAPSSRFSSAHGGLLGLLPPALVGFGMPCLRRSPDINPPADVRGRTLIISRLARTAASLVGRFMTQRLKHALAQKVKKGPYWMAKFDHASVVTPGTLSEPEQRVSAAQSTHAHLASLRRSSRSGPVHEGAAKLPQLL